MEEGFTHFQGYFFCQPEILTASDVPAFKRNCVRFMAELNRPELDFDALEGVVGMLSTPDTLLGRPMDEALDQMPLPEEVRDTLLGRATAMSPVWQLVLAYERARWDQLKDLGKAENVSAGRLPRLYQSAVPWVDRIHRM